MKKLLFLLLIMFCTTLYANQAEVKLTLTKQDKTRKPQIPFENGDYKLNFDSATVTLGTVNTLDLQFSATFNKVHEIALSVHIPLTKKLIYYTNDKKESVLIVAKEPETLTASDFEGMKDKVNNLPLTVRLKLEKYTKVSNDQYDMDGILFRDFRITIQSLECKQGKISTRITFNGDVQQDDFRNFSLIYAMKGVIQIKNQPILLMKIE